MLHGLSWEGGPGWPKGNTFSQPNYQSDQGPCFISPDWWRIFWCLRHLVNFDKIWRIGNGRNILENSETDGLLKAVLQRLCLFGTRFVKRASTDQETDGNLMLVLLQNIRTLHLLFIHVAIATHFPWTSSMTSSLDLAVSLSRAKRNPVSLFQRKANHILEYAHHPNRSFGSTIAMLCLPSCLRYSGCKFIALPGQYQAGLAAAEGRVGLEFN